MSRLLFEKTGESIYISHLDLMRVFQRAFRRAGLLLRQPDLLFLLLLRQAERRHRLHVLQLICVRPSCCKLLLLLLLLLLLGVRLVCRNHNRFACW